MMVLVPFFVSDVERSLADSRTKLTPCAGNLQKGNLHVLDDV